MSDTPRTYTKVMTIKRRPEIAVLEARFNGASYGEQWAAGCRALWDALLEMFKLSADIETELAVYQQAEMPDEPQNCNAATYTAYAKKLRAHAARVTVERNEAKEAQARAESLYKGAIGEGIAEFERRKKAERRLAECEKELENERQKVAACSTAAYGWWKEGDALHPDYECAAIHDVAQLYQRCLGVIAKESGHE